MNPHVTFGIDFGDDFGVSSDSDFLNIYESTVAVCAEESSVTSGSSFGDYF